MKTAAVLVWLLSAMWVAASPAPEIGGVLERNGVHEISVIYTEPVDVISLGNPDNYSIGPGEIVGLRYCATNQGVILRASGLSAGFPGNLNISGVRDKGGNLLPPATLPFQATARFWTVIGANELGFTPEAVSFSEDGYDIFSGSIQQKDDYDDVTFVGEIVPGSFEAKVRVDFVEPAGAGAKAGIMIREILDDEKSRPRNPLDPAQAFSRYVELAVCAPVSARGEPSGGVHRIWQRTTSPSFVTVSLAVTNDAAPAFTNAWLRVERLGQQFVMSRSVDGANWEQIGGASFPEPLPENLYVGLAFSPQNDDLPPASGLRKSFLVRFRDYSLKTTTEGSLRIERVGDHAEVKWDDGWILETSPTITGEWKNADSQQSPLRVDFDETMRFFRLRRPNP